MKCKTRNKALLSYLIRKSAFSRVVNRNLKTRLITRQERLCEARKKFPEYRIFNYIKSEIENNFLIINFVERIVLIWNPDIRDYL
jgi:hypothetical protein